MQFYRKMRNTWPRYRILRKNTVILFTIFWRLLWIFDKPIKFGYFGFDPVSQTMGAYKHIHRQFCYIYRGKQI